jgi:hypothetical protein
VDLWFDGLKRPIRLDGRAVELLPLMHEIIGTWSFREKPKNHVDPVITLWWHSGGFSRTSLWLNETKTYIDPVNAVCDFIVDLTHAYNADHPDVLCLHCAAPIINGQLVVFPNGYNQGKSTLMALLASRHIRILCDDVMPFDLSSFSGKSLGIQPRLRTPLPSGLGNNFDKFVLDHEGRRSDRFQYLNLSQEYLADFGETYPVGGVVVLERNESGENELVPIGQADALKAIILRNFANAMPAADTLNRLSDLINTVKIFRLRYSNGDIAHNLLLDTFA